MFFITKIFSCIIVGNKINQCSQRFEFKQSDWLKKYNDFNTNKKMLPLALKKIFSN